MYNNEEHYAKYKKSVLSAITHLLLICALQNNIKSPNNVLLLIKIQMDIFLPQYLSSW